jgi:hypothetical protein
MELKKMIKDKVKLDKLKNDFINLSDEEIIKKYKYSMATIRSTIVRNYKAHYKEILKARKKNSDKRRGRKFVDIFKYLKKDSNEK